MCRSPCQQEFGYIIENTLPLHHVRDDRRRAGKVIATGSALVLVTSSPKVDYLERSDHCLRSRVVGTQQNGDRFVSNVEFSVYYVAAFMYRSARALHIQFEQLPGSGTAEERQEVRD